MTIDNTLISLSVRGATILKPTANIIMATAMAANAKKIVLGILSTFFSCHVFSTYPYHT